MEMYRIWIWRERSKSYENLWLGRTPNVECIAEEMIPFKNELAVMFVEIHQEK
jgi:phosphoribosylaminoimidazole carboxylase (NCAIR synthetase)